MSGLNPSHFNLPNRIDEERSETNVEDQ
jgi:hypothetical protein